MKKRVLFAFVSMLLVLCIAMPACAATLKLHGMKRITKASGSFGFYADSNNSTYAQWRFSGKNLKFQVQLENAYSSDYVSSYELAMYCTDAYGNVIYPDNCCGDEILYFNCKHSYKPGRVAYSNYCKLPGCAYASEVHVAVTSYKIKGGDTVYLGSSLESDPLKKYTWRHWTIDEGC